MIRDSCTLLKNKRFTPEQFLDRIVHICTKKSDEVLKNVTEILLEDDRSDTNEIDQLNELNVSENPSQQNSTKGMCISCLATQCDIILLPCFHIVICSVCWKSQVETHEKHCEITYKNNKRKFTLEKKKVPCPCCENIVTRAQEFFMATVNS